MNAMTTGVREPVIVVHSALLDQMNDEEVLAIIGHELGHLHAEHPLYHTVVTTLGEIQLAAGKRAEAKRTLDDLIVLEAANQSPVLPTTLTTRAELALGESKWADALGFADRAIASLEASGGRDSADLWRPCAARGRALVALNQPKEAKVALTRAVEIGTKAKVKPEDLGPARAALSAL